jgi:hypothetical protein
MNEIEFDIAMAYFYLLTDTLRIATLQQHRSTLFALTLFFDSIQQEPNTQTTTPQSQQMTGPVNGFTPPGTTSAFAVIREIRNAI